MNAARRDLIDRRTFLAATTAGMSLVTSSFTFAEELSRTPTQTEGPFYPDKLPLDTDNDLLIVNDGVTAAVGSVTHLTGKLVDVRGNPIRNALVEIWQVDNNGAYLHTESGNRDKWDTNFQGFGRLTGRSGEYYFRTIKPVPYPGRTPHIHFKVKKKGQPDFVTQCYIKGHPLNERDGVIQRTLKDPRAVSSLMVDFKPIKESKIGELAASFDIVLGHTPSQG